MRFSAVCLTLLLFFSVALASCPPVVSQGLHNYYFLPVPAPNYLGFYMDDVLPSGPLMECNSPCEFFNVPGWPLMECKASCNFFTRPFANSQTVYGITGVIYVEYHVSGAQPLQETVRLFYCVGGKEWCGWSDYILKGSTPIAFQVTAQTPGTTFEKGTILDFTLAYDYPVYNLPNFTQGSFRILFGDREHRSSLVTQKLDLEGQPVPEFPSILIMLPVILTLTILLRRERNGRKKPSS
jgi:hypothetical protein